MKVTVLQENLARGLATVAKAVSPRSTLPVLANILIASDEGRLRLSATNLEMGITCWIPARIDEEGSTTVPARTFSDLVSTLPSDQVLLKLDPTTQTLNVRGGTSTNDIKCIGAGRSDACRSGPSSRRTAPRRRRYPLLPTHTSGR